MDSQGDFGDGLECAYEPLLDCGDEDWRSSDVHGQPVVTTDIMPPATKSLPRRDQPASVTCSFEDVSLIAHMPLLSPNPHQRLNFEQRAPDCVKSLAANSIWRPPAPVDESPSPVNLVPGDYAGNLQPIVQGDTELTSYEFADVKEVLSAGLSAAIRKNYLFENDALQQVIETSLETVWPALTRTAEAKRRIQHNVLPNAQKYARRYIRNAIDRFPAKAFLATLTETDVLVTVARVKAVVSVEAVMARLKSHQSYLRCSTYDFDPATNQEFAMQLRRLRKDVEQRVIAARALVAGGEARSKTFDDAGIWAGLQAWKRGGNYSLDRFDEVDTKLPDFDRPLECDFVLRPAKQAKRARDKRAFGSRLGPDGTDSSNKHCKRRQSGKARDAKCSVRHESMVVTKSEPRNNGHVKSRCTDCTDSVTEDDVVDTKAQQRGIKREMRSYTETIIISDSDDTDVGEAAILPPLEACPTDTSVKPEATNTWSGRDLPKRREEQETKLHQCIIKKEGFRLSTETIVISDGDDTDVGESATDQGLPPLEACPTGTSVKPEPTMTWSGQDILKCREPL